MYGVTITELIKKMDFRNLTPEIDADKIVLSHPDVNRPALQLTGFYDHFDNERVQMLGNVELAYLSGLTTERRKAMYDKQMCIRDSIRNIERMTGHRSGDKIRKLLEFAGSTADCRDPWYSGAFDETYRDVVTGCTAFLEYLEKEGRI